MIVKRRVWRAVALLSAGGNNSEHFSEIQSAICFNAKFLN
jgi:hypothetical protein